MADLAAPGISVLTTAAVDPTADLALVYDSSATDMKQMTVADFLYRHQGWIPVTDAATLALDSKFGHNIRFETTITANRALGTPTNPVDGAIFTIRIKQGGAGGFTISLAAYTVPTSLDTTPSTTAGMTDFLTAVYIAAGSRWVVLAYTKGAAGL
jgi:hypothetical protein